MCLTFKKNNMQTKKPVNCFLQDDAGAGIRSLQTSTEIKLCQNPWNELYAREKLTYISREQMGSSLLSVDDKSQIKILNTRNYKF